LQCVRTIHGELPPSRLASAEALALIKSRAKARPHSAPTKTREEYRKVHDAALKAFVETMRQDYPTTMVEQSIAGVRPRIFTPQNKPVDLRRVLINIQGGGFDVKVHARDYDKASAGSGVIAERQLQRPALRTLTHPWRFSFVSGRRWVSYSP